MKTLGILVVAAMCMGAINCFAADAPKVNPFKEALAKVPSAELPAQAAELVKNAKPPEQETTTIDVVTAAVLQNPAAAPAIVGAIARAVPDMAALAAATAAKLQPRQAAAIAKAAAAAAPSMAGRIVAAVCGVVPKDYRGIALAVSEAVPGAGREILGAVAASVPDLKPSIDKLLASSSGDLSVPIALDSMSPLISAPMAHGSFSPPFVPPSGTPGNGSPSVSGQPPQTGRNYAAP